MSGFDKAKLCCLLEKLGWIEDPDRENHYIPPESLWIDKQKSFYVYDAVEIQDLLGIFAE